jgi:predicted nucleic acid-binding protein
MDNVIRKIVEEHKLVLSSFVIAELTRVVERKFPKQLDALDKFLTALPFELVYTPKVIAKDLFQIRDEMDYPVLYSAIIEDIDILITGDKDFDSIEIERPEILSPKQFLER